MSEARLTPDERQMLRSHADRAGMDGMFVAVDRIIAGRIAQARGEGAAEALKKIASDPEVIKKVKWRIDHYGPLDAEPFQFSRYESVAHAALSVLGDRVDALRGDA